MIITLLSTLGLILAIVVMIMSAYVASRLETIDIQGQLCVMLNSTNTKIAYENAIIAAVFTGVIIAIFIASMIFDIIHENKQNKQLNSSKVIPQSQINQLQQSGTV